MIGCWRCIVKRGLSVNRMSDSLPKISVIIPLYNQAESIGRTIESVLGQSLSEFEVIVVDDGSMDGGGDVVAGLVDSWVRLVAQDNQGVSAARNRGVQEARGEIVAFLDADDEWCCDYLETIVSLVEQYPTCSVYATSYVMRDDDGGEQLPLMRHFPALEGSFIFTNYFDVASVSTPPLWTGAVAVQKSAIEQIGGFPVGVVSGEDLLTWARLYCEFDIAYDPAPKGIYNKGSLSWRHAKRVPEVRDSVGEGLKALLIDPEIDAEKKRGLRRYIGLWKKIRASHFIALGDRVQALATVAQSIWFYPWNLKVWLYIPYTLLPHLVQNKLITIVEKNVSQGQSRI